MMLAAEESHLPRNSILNGLEMKVALGMQISLLKLQSMMGSVYKYVDKNLLSKFSKNSTT